MNTRIPFLDVGATYREIREEVDAAVARVLESGWYILGPEVEAFEEEFAAFAGARHCVGVGNGLEALTLGLHALGVGPDDEVIVPSNTYIATWLAVSHLGATPVPVEPVPETMNLDPTRVEQAITSRTRAILPVHLYGQAAAMGPICEIAERRGVAVLDDAAQAHGARWANQLVGSMGDITAWSFYPGKNLGAFGDAGAITTNDAELADSVRVMRNYGSRRKYHNEVKGVNSRLAPLQAAVLRVKLKHLDAWNQRRVELARCYLDGLQDTPLTLPEVAADATSVWHVFAVRTALRQALQEHLTAGGVQTLIHYPIPPHLQPAYQEMGAPRGSFPIAEEIHDTVFSLPIGPHLPDDDAQRVIACIRGFFDAQDATRA